MVAALNISRVEGRCFYITPVENSRYAYDDCTLTSSLEQNPDITTSKMPKNMVLILVVSPLASKRNLATYHTV